VTLEPHCVAKLQISWKIENYTLHIRILRMALQRLKVAFSDSN
jgi:hypothetical protein